MQKVTTERDRKYLDWIRSLHCVVCQGRPVHAHHEGKRGIGIKASDYDAIPLCENHHRERHQIGQKSFWGSTEPSAIIKRLQTIYRGQK